MNEGYFPTYSEPRYGAAMLPNGVVKLTNLSPGIQSNRYVYNPGGGMPVRMGTARWNTGMGGYLDERGNQIANYGNDETSVMNRVLAAIRSGAGRGGGPALYGDSYGDVTGRAQSARNAEVAAQQARDNAAQAAAQFASTLQDSAANRDFNAQQNAANRATQLMTARIQSAGRGGGGWGSFEADSSGAPRMSPASGPVLSTERFVEGATPYYQPGTGYTRDREVWSADKGWQLVPRGLPAAALLPQPAEDYGRRLTAGEQNVLNAPANVAALRSDLEPALGRRADMNTALDNNTKLQEAMDRTFKERVDAGDYVWDKQAKRYEAAAGPAVSSLPDGTPLDPAQAAAMQARRLAQNTARLKQHEADLEATAKVVADLDRKRANTEAEVRDILETHKGAGLTFRQPLGPDAEPGPGQIYFQGRAVGGVPVNRQVSPAGVPAASGALTPDNPQFKALANARRLALARAGNQLRSERNAAEVRDQSDYASWLGWTPQRKDYFRQLRIKRDAENPAIN